MHWVLDVSMNEDACQIYKDHGAENLACLRHMGLNMLRAEPTKRSVVGKQKPLHDEYFNVRSSVERRFYSYDEN